MIEEVELAAGTDAAGKVAYYDFFRIAYVYFYGWQQYGFSEF